MKYLKYIAVLGLAAFIVSSCIDEINLDISSDERSIIVDGLISDRPGVFSVTISYSPVLGIGNDNILDPISDADVVLKNTNGDSFNYQEDPETPGQYNAELNLSRGETYYIEVKLPNGDIIKSNPQSFPNVSPEIENIDFDVVNEEIINESGNVSERERVNLFLSTTTLDENTFLRWRVKGEYQFVERAFGLLFPRNCYVKDNLDFNNIVLAESADFSDRRVNDLPIISTPFNERFHIVYLYNIFQYSIHPEEFNYWKQIDQLINIDGTLFDPPPGVIFGNLKNESNPDQNIQGYFSVASERFERFFAVPSRKGFFIDSDCFSRPNAPNPERCTDCTTITNSTLERPDYWVF